jgi:uncharacterized integral membrane protein
MTVKPRTVVYIVVFLVLAVFVLANWQEIARPTRINLLIMEMHAPLGLLLLLIVGGILLLDWAVHGISRFSWSRERRVLLRELEESRLRADKAEESRIHALREAVERETAAIRGQLERVLAVLHASGGTPGEFMRYDERGAPARYDDRNGTVLIETERN